MTIKTSQSRTSRGLRPKHSRSPDNSEPVPRRFILPSAIHTVKRQDVCTYRHRRKRPAVGDLVYGEVESVGCFETLENRSGRKHELHVGSRAVFVFGNRYAPSYHEGHVPRQFLPTVDLLSQSGMVGVSSSRNSNLPEPPRIHILGYVEDARGQIVSSRDSYRPAVSPASGKRPASPILVFVGTSMNCGKSSAAVAACWALRRAGYDVNACKITGTASLKDTYHMQDAGAREIADFSHLGYPSTYLLPPHELEGIFRSLDQRYGSDPGAFLVVEIADGLLQRETEALLRMRALRRRIHRLTLCAPDGVSAVAGHDLLRKRFRLRADAISGLCSSSPLWVREIRSCNPVPVFDSKNRNVKEILNALQIQA